MIYDWQKSFPQKAKVVVEHLNTGVSKVAKDIYRSWEMGGNCDSLACRFLRNEETFIKGIRKLRSSPDWSRENMLVQIPIVRIPNKDNPGVEL